MHILNTFVDHTEILQRFPRTKAFLWDMDGTIMETERLHAKATIKLLKSYKVNITPEVMEVQNYCIGMTDSQLLKELVKRQYLPQMQDRDFINQKNGFLYDLMSTISKQDIFSEKVRQLIHALKDRNIPQVIVTSSEREVAEKFLSHLELEHFFDFIIAREDVGLNKPHPMPYITAMQKLGLNKEEVCIFEDSVTGLKAANSSGANVFHVKWYQDHNSRL